MILFAKINIESIFKLCYSHARAHLYAVKTISLECWKIRGGKWLFFDDFLTAPDRRTKDAPRRFPGRRWRLMALAC